MRYDTTVIFRHTVPGAYDPETGNYAADSYIDCPRYASVMDTSEETMRLLFGEIREGTYTVQLQTPLDMAGEPDRVIIGGHPYSIERRRRLRQKETYIVTRIQG